MAAFECEDPIFQAHIRNNLSAVGYDRVCHFDIIIGGKSGFDDRSGTRWGPEGPRHAMVFPYLEGNIGFTRMGRKELLALATTLIQAARHLQDEDRQ